MGYDILWTYEAKNLIYYVIHLMISATKSQTTARNWVRRHSQISFYLTEVYNYLLTLWVADSTRLDFPFFLVLDFFRGPLTSMP